MSFLATLSLRMYQSNQMTGEQSKAGAGFTDGPSEVTKLSTTT
jgi:hypothetical protein